MSNAALVFSHLAIVAVLLFHLLLEERRIRAIMMKTDLGKLFPAPQSRDSLAETQQQDPDGNMVLTRHTAAIQSIRYVHNAVQVSQYLMLTLLLGAFRWDWLGLVLVLMAVCGLLFKDLLFDTCSPEEFFTRCVFWRLTPWTIQAILVILLNLASPVVALLDAWIFMGPEGVLE